MAKQRHLDIRIVVVALIAGLVLFVVLYLGNCAFGLKQAGEAVLTGNASLFSDGYKRAYSCRDLILYYDQAPKVLGNNTFIVLLQNNWELRPSGGFMGSYALVQFENNVLKDISVQDIYVPDGQIQGHVNPPKPVLQAFQQGFWRLRDANWDPDFQKSAENEKGIPKKIFVANVSFGAITFQS